MSIFGATALGTHINGQSNLIVLLNESGYESIVYAIMNLYPYSKYLACFFIFIVYLSYVTAADSNTEAMGAISVKNFNAENDSAPIFIKIIWGVCIGSIAYIMVNSSGVVGIKMLSNLGGVPALFLLTFVMIGMCIIIVRSYSKDFEL
jgi:choline-glycine betaine transporter